MANNKTPKNLAMHVLGWTEPYLRGIFLAAFCIALLGVIGIGISILRYWDVFWVDWQDFHEEWRNLAFTIAGVFGFLAGVFTLYNSTRRSEEQGRDCDINDRREIGERFDRAIDMLGNNSSVIRLGGIHSLELLAQEGAADRERAIDILAAFTRDRTHQVPGKPVTDDIRGAIQALSSLSNEDKE